MASHQFQDSVRKEVWVATIIIAAGVLALIHLFR
jgi:hypothetical protein